MRFQQIVLLGGVVVGLLSVLWLVIAALLAEHIPNEFRPVPDFNYTFDYVVVGAGTAGSVVASLLSKHSDASVLLIEAGATFGFLSKIPLLTTFQQKGVNDWAFLSVPQRHSSMGLVEQRQCLPRGRGLGGSSLLNYMLHFDANARDFDVWARVHNLSDWRWSSVKPFLEAARPKPLEMLEIGAHYSKIAEAIYRAEAEFSGRAWHFRRARYNIKSGLRYSVLQRFLQPAMRNANLRILTHAMAKRIELTGSGKHARVRALLLGIKDEHTRKEHVFSVQIGRELIVAAGAYQTPQLLLASGIGDRQQLMPLGIPLQLHLPQVGQNLHDHINLPLFVSIDEVGPSLNRRALLDPLSLLNYLATGAGHWGNFGVLGHIDADDDEHFGLTFFAAGAIDETALMSISNFRRAHFRALFPRYHNATQEGFVLISTCFQPKSRGTVTVRSANMRRNPQIDPNYLSAVEDVHCTVRAIRAAVAVVTSDAFASLRPRIHWPRIKECSDFGPFERDFRENAPTERYLECVLRHVGLGSHHPGGTCAMGTSPQNSVVDGQFRLHDVPNLRIVDASVQPTPISGNPHATVVGMAVRAATLVLKDEWNGRVA